MKIYNVTHISKVAFKNHLEKLKKRKVKIISISENPYKIKYTWDANGNTIVNEAIKDAVSLKRFPFDYEDGKFLYSLKNKIIDGNIYYKEVNVPIDKKLPSGKHKWIFKPIGKNGKIFIYLLENYFIEDTGKYNKDAATMYSVSDSGKDFINVVDNRIETIRGLKEGTDLFPKDI